MKNRILTVIILGAVLACLLTVGASAVTDTVTASGTCGSKLTWKLYDDNELVISGTGKMTEWNMAMFAPWYKYRSQITSIVIESGVTTIGYESFREFSALTNVEIADTVTAIADKAFRDCKSLSTLKLGNGIKTIGDEAFSWCYKLTSVTIPDSVTTIDNTAFYYCTGLTSVKIGKGATTIGDHAFGGCTKLKNVTVYSKTAKFGKTVFKGTHSSLTIHGYLGSTAETYAANNSHTFASLDKFNVSDTATQTTFTVKVVDYKTGKAISGASVSLGGVSGTTDSTGKVSLKKPSSLYSNMIISADGYISRGMMGYSAYTDTSIDIIRMFPVGGTKIIPETCNGKPIDTARAQINNKADLYAEIEISGESEYGINKFQLRQGGTVLGESADGDFKIHNSAFKKGVPVVAYMHTTAGLFYKELNVDVVSFEFFPSSFPLGAETIKVPDNVTLFGGVEIKLEHGKHSAEFEVTNDQIKVGYNQTVKEKDLKKLNQGLRNWMNANGRKVTSEAKGFEVGGYVIVDVGNNGVKSAKGQVVFSFNYSNGAGKTFFLLVPVRVEADFKVEGQVIVDIVGYDFENAQIIWPAVDASFGGSVTARAGVGGYLASAGVYGSLGLTLDLNVLPRFMVDSLVASGEIGIYAKAVVLGEAKLPLIDGDLVLYDKDRAATYSLRRAALYNTESYTLSEREYLSERSGWSGASDTLQTDVSASADPIIAAAGDATVMVWLDDSGSTDEYNYQQLMYSVLTESGWSTPTGVDSNALNDAEYELYSDGKSVWLAYTEANRAIGAEDDMTAMAGTLEMVTARFDAALGAFTDRTVITSNDTMDTKPNITVVEGVPTAVWVNNADNNLFGMTADNTVYMSRYENGTWSTTTIADNTAAVVTTDAGTLDGSLAISVIHDADSDFATVGDSVITVYRADGESTSMKQSTYESVLNSSDKLYFYDSGAVYSIDTYGGESVLVSGELSTNSAADFDIVLEDERTYLLYRVYNTEGERGGSDIYAVMLDGNTASAPIRLTETEGYVDSFSASDTAEGLTIAYRSTDATFEGGEFNTASDLCSLTFIPDVKLEITDIAFDHTDLFGDDKVTLTVSVRNAGAKTAEGFTLSCGGILTEYTDGVNAGETVEVEVEFPLNGTDSVYSFTVTDENGFTNTKTAALGYADFAVSAESILVADTPYVNVNVENIGSLSGGGTLTVRDGDENGEIIHTENTTLNAGEQKYVLLEIISATLESVYVEFSTNGADYFDGNNHVGAKIYRFTVNEGEITLPPMEFITSDNSALAPDTQILAIEAEENDTTYSMGDVNFYWSSRYNAYLAIVGDDVTEDDVISLLTATEGADPDVIAYDGDVNGDGKVTAGDAALVARLLVNPDIDGCTDLMRLEADAYASTGDNGYSVTLDDVKSILYAAVGLEYN